MKYFLKQCGFQELGSVGKDGKVNRGRYLMTSKNNEVVDFFPPLSIEIPNDNDVITLLPLFSGMKTFCNYVYHNSKYTGTNAKHGRNEYRIYLNSEIENHKLFFKAEDIVIFRKSGLSVIEKERNTKEFYYVDVINDHSSATFLRLSKIIESYPIKGGYGMYEGDLDFFEEKVRAFENGQILPNIVVDKSVTDRIARNTDKIKNNIFNTATFREFVLAGYGSSCAISGQMENENINTNIDVVYICPRGVGGDCMPSNGIAFAKKFSLAFLEGKFTLSDRYEIIIHPHNDIKDLNKYEYRQIRVPSNKFFQPDINSVRYHREHIYGTFAE